MNKALLLAYHYPPLGGPGVFRTLKFTKYLPKFNYQPFILTVKNPLYKIKDSSLMAEIPPKANVNRVFSFEHRLLRVPRLLNMNLKWFYLPDEHIGWLPFAIFHGSKLVKKEGIEVIFATSPSYTTLLIGSLLKKKTKKSLVIDFRDPWVNNSFIEYPTKLHKLIESKMEEYVLTQADYITVATDLIKDDLIQRYPFVKPKIETLTNGFDPEDFEKLELQKQSSKFRIAYTGSIYGDLTARTFLGALKELIIENEELKKNIEIVFVGNYGKETQNLVRKLSLEENVKLQGYVPHKKCLELIAESNVLLLLITVLGSKGKEILTGKIFEYLASNKPIIAIAPKDNLASKLIKSLDAGVIVPPRNLELTKEAILLFYKKWKIGELIGLTINSNELQKFNRVNLTQRLSRIFDKINK
jgi:glycosyltransferase involved in cell wall biosynthesis